MIVFEFFYDKMEVFGPKMDDMARYLEMEEDLEMEEEEEGEEEEEEGEEKEEEEGEEEEEEGEEKEEEEGEEEEEEGEEKEEEEEVSLFIVLFLSLCFCLPKCLSVMPPPSGTCTHSLAPLGHQCLLPCQTAGEGGL